MTKVLDLGKLTQFGQDGPFEQIRMKGLNMEQIWGQMNLKNNAFLDRAGNAIKGWYGDDAMDIDDEMDMDDEDDLMDEELDDEDDDEEEDDEEDEEEDDEDEEEDDLEDEEEFQGFEDEEEADQDEETETLSAPKRTYEVDDEFFSLEKMEEFVQEAERNEMKEDDEVEEDDDDDENDVDLFADPDELDDSDADVDVNDIKFGDFFLPNSKKTTSRSKLSFKKGVDDQDLEEDGDQMDVDEEEPELEDEEVDEDEEDQKSSFKVKKTSNLFDDDDDIMVDEDGEPLSNFEKKQAQMNEIIHDLEMENLDDKTWTMKGEVNYIVCYTFTL